MCANEKKPKQLLVSRYSVEFIIFQCFCKISRACYLTILHTLRLCVQLCITYFSILTNYRNLRSVSLFAMIQTPQHFYWNSQPEFLHSCLNIEK